MIENIRDYVSCSGPTAKTFGLVNRSTTCARTQSNIGDAIYYAILLSWSKISTERSKKWTTWEHDTSVQSWLKKFWKVDHKRVWKLQNSSFQLVHTAVYPLSLLKTKIEKLSHSETTYLVDSGTRIDPPNGYNFFCPSKTYTKSVYDFQ